MMDLTELAQRLEFMAEVWDCGREPDHSSVTRRSAKALREANARIAELEAWQDGVLEWLAHECGIGPDEMPNHLALQEIESAQSHP